MKKESARTLEQEQQGKLEQGKFKEPKEKLEL
jgi:hypothetical protein